MTTQNSSRYALRVAFVASTVLLAATVRADIVSTIQNAKSGTTVSASGTYSVSGKIHVPAGVTVKGPATFKFSSSSTDGFVISTGYSGVTLQSLTVTGAYHGIIIYGKSNKITSCTATANGNTGIICENSGSTGNSISSCLSYNNADSSGGNADGFGAKQGPSGNTFSNCTAYENSDDGWDLEKSAGVETLTGCLSYTEGKSTGGKVGNGNGFKMGISGDNIAHVLTSCTAHHNTAGDSAHGFAANHNTGKIKLTTCHSYSNKNKDDLGNSVLSNCTMQQ